MKCIISDITAQPHNFMLPFLGCCYFDFWVCHLQYPNSNHLIGYHFFCCRATFHMLVNKINTGCTGSCTPSKPHLFSHFPMLCRVITRALHLHIRILWINAVIISITYLYSSFHVSLKRSWGAAGSSLFIPSYMLFLVQLWISSPRNICILNVVCPGVWVLWTTLEVFKSHLWSAGQQVGSYPWPQSAALLLPSPWSFSWQSQPKLQGGGGGEGCWLDVQQPSSPTASCWAGRSDITHPWCPPPQIPGYGAVSDCQLFSRVDMDEGPKKATRTWPQLTSCMCNPFYSYLLSPSWH